MVEHDDGGMDRTRNVKNERPRVSGQSRHDSQLDAVWSVTFVGLACMVNKSRGRNRFPVGSTKSVLEYGALNCGDSTLGISETSAFCTPERENVTRMPAEFRQIVPSCWIMLGLQARQVKLAVVRPFVPWSS